MPLEATPWKIRPNYLSNMTKTHLITGLLLAFCNILPIHADKFGIWTDAELAHDLGNTGLGLDFDLGFRAGNNLKNVDRWSAGVALNYNLFTFLKVGGGYTYIYSYSPTSEVTKYKKDDDGNLALDPNGQAIYNGYNVTQGYWRNKNRFHFDIKGQHTFGRFTISLRERYQATIFNHTSTEEYKYRFNTSIDQEGNKQYVLKPGYPEENIDEKKHKTTHYLRSKLEIDYNIPHCKVNPYAWVMFSNNLSNGFSTDKRRYSAGADWKIKKGMHLSFGYVYNHGNDDDEDGRLHAIEISYKIKGLFF